MKYSFLVLSLILSSFIFKSNFVDAELLTGGNINMYVERSDNIFSLPADRAVSGFTYLLSPYINLTVPGEKMRANFGYLFTWERNMISGGGTDVPAIASDATLGNVSLNDYDRQYHNFSGNYSWDATRKVTLNVTGSYDVNFQNKRTGQIFTFTPNESTRSDSMKLNSNILWRLSKKINIDIGVSKDVSSYDNPLIASMTTDRFWGTWVYNLTSKVQLGAGINYSNIGYGSIDNNRPNIRNYSDQKLLEYSAYANINLKYIILGFSYGLLQRTQDGKTITITGGGLGGGGGRGGTSFSSDLSSFTRFNSTFSLNFSTNPKTFRFKNFTFSSNMSQKFYIDIAGQPYISKILTGSVNYTKKTLSGILSMNRSQSDYLDNDNKVIGTGGTLNIQWNVTKKFSVSINGNITKYEYASDSSVSSVLPIPGSFPANRSGNKVSEAYLNLSYTWGAWMSTGLSFGRRNGESLGGLLVSSSDIISGGYTENIVSFSNVITF